MTINEDITGSGTVISVGHEERWLDGLVIQKCTSSHDYSVGRGRLTARICVGCPYGGPPTSFYSAKGAR